MTLSASPMLPHPVGGLLFVQVLVVMSYSAPMFVSVWPPKLYSPP